MGTSITFAGQTAITPNAQEKSQKEGKGRPAHPEVLLLPPLLFVLVAPQDTFRRLVANGGSKNRQIIKHWSPPLSHTAHSTASLSDALEYGYTVGLEGRRVVTEGCLESIQVLLWSVRVVGVPVYVPPLKKTLAWDQLLKLL